MFSRSGTWWTLAALALAGGGAASAADLGVAGRKLIVVDKVTAASKAKVVFVAKGDAGIAKGPGGDPAGIDGTFEMFYESGGSSVDGGA